MNSNMFKYILVQNMTSMKKQYKKPHLALVQTKWRDVLPNNFQLHWNNVWEKGRGRKEAGFMWQIWHKAVAVNVWRG
jgi:hypothetical protein